MQERISDAELAIMEALWAESPLTATDVAARVQGERGWSLTTVKDFAVAAACESCCRA